MTAAVEFIVWNGGPMPIKAGTLVLTRHRGFSERVSVAGAGYATRWEHKGEVDDIVAYASGEQIVGPLAEAFNVASRGEPQAKIADLTDKLTALVRALGYKPDAMDRCRELILMDAAGLRPAMVEARRQLRDAEGDALNWQLFVDLDGPSLLQRVWKQRQDYRRRAEQAEAKLALFCCGNPVHVGSPEGYTLECCEKFVSKPVAWLRHGEKVPVQGAPFGAMWISDGNDPRSFPVYAHPPARSSADVPGPSYQDRVAAAHHALFHDDPTDVAERTARFFEEAVETCQALGLDFADAHKLVNYTYDRPVGEPAKEIGAAMLTLTSLCVVAGYDLMAYAEADLKKLQRPETIARIRAKRATRHGRGPLPGLDPASGQPEAVEKCPICAEPFKDDDLCATDIELSTCHAACLDGAAIVDLETGEPSEGPISTYLWSEVH